MNYDVPFISNTPDDLHCLQAVYGMIRQYFEPDWQWEDNQVSWNAATGFVPDKGSWALAGMQWFKDNGYEVHHIAKFDYARFAEEGLPYLMEALGPEAGEWERRMTDIPLEQARSRQLVQSGMWVPGAPTLDDIKGYLDKSFLVKCLINLRALNGEDGYLGHAVLAKGYTDDELILHDPGLPARPDRHVPFADFEAAWKNPNTNAEKIDAIRLNYLKFTKIYAECRSVS